MLRRQRGMRRARQVSTAVAAMVGACDGDLTVGQIAQALATLLDVSDRTRCEPRLIEAVAQASFWTGSSTCRPA